MFILADIGFHRSPMELAENRLLLSLFRLFSAKTLKDYSPLNHINSDWPPVLMFHGTADHTVSIRQSEELDERLTEEGIAHRFHVVPGGDHGFFNKSREEWRSLERECLEFLLPLISSEA